MISREAAERVDADAPALSAVDKMSNRLDFEKLPPWSIRALALDAFFSMPNMRPLVPLRLFALAIFSAPAPTLAEPLVATPADRVAIEACLKLVDENGQKQAQKPDADEAPGAGRLAGAAKEAATESESCVGAVTIPCQQAPGGYSTIGMVACNTREWAVWDERLNRAYRKSQENAPSKLAKAMRETQRAWLQWREKRCGLPEIENEGGTIVGPLYTSCMLDTTARQALWLESRK